MFTSLSKAEFIKGVKGFSFQFLCLIAWVLLGSHPIIALFLGIPLALTIGLFWHIINEPIKWFTGW